MKFTFHGGVHPEGHKDLSRDVPLRLFDPKGEMVYPLSQHIGKPARPIVKRETAYWSDRGSLRRTALFRPISTAPAQARSRQ